jgi:hypothetical protein
MMLFYIERVPTLVRFYFEILLQETTKHFSTSEYVTVSRKTKLHTQVLKGFTLAT